MKIFQSLAGLFLLLNVALAQTASVPVATVNGTAISKADLEAEVNKLIPQATYHGTVTEETKAALRDKALQTLIVRELQYQDALARGLKPDKQQVKQQLASIRDRYPSKKDYKAALDQAGLNEDTLKKEVEKFVLVQMVLSSTVLEPAAVNEAGLKEYYEKNKAKFKQPESVRLRLISTRARRARPRIY